MMHRIFIIFLTVFLSFPILTFLAFAQIYSTSHKATSHDDGKEFGFRYWKRQTHVDELGEGVFGCTTLEIEGVFGFTEEDVYADCDNASVHRDSWSREHGHRQMGVTMTKSPLPPHRRNGSKAQDFRQLIPFRMDPTKSNQSTSARNEYCIWRHKVATFSFPLRPLFSLNISRPFVPTKNGPKFITSSEQPGPVIVDVSDEIDQVRQGTHTAPLLQGRVAKVVTINQNLSFWLAEMEDDMSDYLT